MRQALCVCGGLAFPRSAGGALRPGVSLDSGAALLELMEQDERPR